MSEAKIDRDLIINKLVETFKPNEKVYAFWLEGADGLGKVDQYSNLDFVIDVEDGYETKIFELCEQALSLLGELDLNYEEDHGHPKLRQKVYHLKNSSPYLEIDFCVQSHSRDKSGSTFIEKSIFEYPKVFFDKAKIVSYRARNESDQVKISQNIARKKELFNLLSQYHRVLKYCERNKFLEAFGYYQKHILRPMIELMRIKYTPYNTDYYIVHISDHLPEEELKLLEGFHQVTSVADIKQNINKALEWLKEFEEFEL